MQCPSCKLDNSDSANFCSECGAQLQVVCTACKSASPVGKKFCADCGTPLRRSARPASQSSSQKLSASGERRQVTVLFCDIVGYTELTSSMDAERLQEVVSIYEDVCTEHVTRFDGFIYQLMGDGIVAFFGYPRAREAVAERAILAGRQILADLGNREMQGIGHLRVRVGIATGVVVTSGTDVAAYGETMNLAARLQTVAKPGTIAISSQVRKLAGGAFEYLDLGQISLKGFQEAVRVYQVSGLGSAATRFDAAAGEHLTQFVGRETELNQLKSRWLQAKDGRGHVMLVSGEAGIGKSRVLSALRAVVEKDGPRSMRFQCSPFYTNTAFYPWIEYFERTFEFEPSEPAPSKLKKLEALLHEQYQLARADVRFVASLLSIPHDDRYGPHGMTPQKFKEETIRTLVEIVSSSARQSPQVLFFEDAHWSDATTVEVLDALINRVAMLPLLIVITFRPEFVENWSHRDEVDLFNLAQLSADQSAAVIHCVAGNKALPTVLVNQLVERADGIPLYVEELTKAVLESEELQDLGDRFEHAGAAQAMAVPATLRDSLIARLDRHSVVKELAQIGAAIGRSFPYSLICAVSPLPEDSMEEALERLIESGLVFINGQAPNATYTFKHALVQDAAYDSLLKSDRQMLHASLARVIEANSSAADRAEPELLAHHYTQAGDLAAAVPLWKQAGERELARMSFNEAIRHLGHGIELVSKLPQGLERDRLELELRSMQGVAWMATKGFPSPEARACFLPALKLVSAAQSNKETLRVYWGLWSNTLSGGRVASSAHRAEEFLTLGQKNSDTDLIVVGHLMMCVTMFWLGKLESCCEHAESIVSLYDSDGHRYLGDVINHDPLTGAFLYQAQAVWIQGHPDRAVAICKAMDEHTKQRGHVFDAGFSLAAGSDVFQYRGEPEIQLSRADECDAIGRHNSLTVLSKVIGPLRRGAALIGKGEYTAGAELLREALEIREAGGGYGGSNPYFKGLLAEGLARSGDVPAAMKIIEEQIVQMERPNWLERCHYAEIVRLKGWLLSLDNQADAAEKHYRASLEHAQRQGAQSWALRASISLARLWQGQGKVEQAFELVDAIQGWFTEGFDSKDLREAQQLLSELSA